jgi:hypothetical protein
MIPAAGWPPDRAEVQCFFFCEDWDGMGGWRSGELALTLTLRPTTKFLELPRPVGRNRKWVRLTPFHVKTKDKYHHSMPVVERDMSCVS